LPDNSERKYGEWSRDENDSRVEETPNMNIKARVSFLTNDVEIKTIAVLSTLYSIRLDRMTGRSAVASSKIGLESTRRFSI
jgi:hypothetical protein